VPVRVHVDELEARWRSASSDYARTVTIYGAGTPEAREAWEFAKEALDAAVRSKAQVFKDEAEARAAAVASS
jgi:Xaa-Pro aminopeptidase